jgi:hypothetical protein
MATRYYQAVFHADHADPPLTLCLIEVEGRNAREALKENLDKVVASAQEVCQDYFGAEIFTTDELVSQIHIIAGNGRWFAAEDL